MIIGIHQPNYLPWIGFFHKLVQCDTFVIFDDVQLPTGKDYETMNTIKTANGVVPLRVPIVGRDNNLLIKDALIADDKWRKKHLGSITTSYKNCPFFEKYIGRISEIYNKHWDKLIDLNVAIIKLFNEFLGIKAKLVYSSDLGVTTNGEQKIIDIVKKLGGDIYISGIGEGSKRYVIPEDFEKEGILLSWQDFKHPVYPQLWGEFVPYLSMLDYLFNCGDYCKL